MPAHPVDEEGCSAWNPGVMSWIPPEFRKFETLFRAEWADVSQEELMRFADLSGLPEEDLTVWRPTRLALHELIIRVTADIAVAEGEEEKDFGENFRRIVRRIFNHDIMPRLPEIEAGHAALMAEAEALAAQILKDSLTEPASVTVTPPQKAGWLSRLFSGGKPAGRGDSRNRGRSVEAEESVADRDCRIVAEYKAAASIGDEPLRQAVYRALHRLLGSLMGRHGRICGEPAVLATIAAHLVANGHGSRAIGRRIAPLVEEAIEREGYRRVVVQSAPVLISLKGASASGKSYVRPMLRQTMREYGVEPGSYATISPDIWRRLLLHYESLGPAHKYAGQLTSREVMVIDRKLDHYIQFKANRDNAMPHLVVDRFRFDSFSGDQVGKLLHKTYVRHVHTLVMYFLVTPPEETVERGWLRALERGRYKSVEDFLAHAVEAYTGMPKIFFRWLDHAKPAFRYRFLDNRVPKGCFPTTITRGDQQAITIVDPLGLMNIERYQKVNIYAATRGEVYPPGADLSVAGNCGFLREVVRRLPRVEFTLDEKSPPYLVVEKGTFRVTDSMALAAARENRERTALFDAIAPEIKA